MQVSSINKETKNNTEPQKGNIKEVYQILKKQQNKFVSRLEICIHSQISTKSVEKAIYNLQNYYKFNIRKKKAIDGVVFYKLLS